MTLHLTLKKKWFDMILSGQKKYEYRELKPYWRKRFVIDGTHPPVCVTKYDYVLFSNGYSKDCPKMKVKLNHIFISFGKPEIGGDPNNLQFVLWLGDVIETQNTK